jgi:uncharacterized membrane protein YidH (DUF202 family)
MSKKETIGVILITVGVGALVYLYNGYYKAYQEIKKETTK